MTRKAARGRKTATRTRTSSARSQARTSTRTGRKTSSARASKIATPTTKRGAAPAAGRQVQSVEAETMHEPVPTAQHEDDEDMDWLGEDEDPRSQIVEDEDEWEPAGDDEW